ncbi:redoxin domain-containing protein [Sphaerimonospora mesophila]|uniref:redoxin domain-containing protein n=1 Tax=Sphaerimonospora mesophila TaxID=37483 RepID=UPI0006E12FA3
MVILYVLCCVLATGLIINMAVTSKLSGAVSALRKDLDHSYAEQLATPHLLGSTVAHFMTHSTQGAPIDSTALSEEFVVGFFMIGCPPCKTSLPLFVDVCKRIRTDGTQIVSVIRYESGELDDEARAEELRKLTSRLEECSHVVTEDGDQEVISAFGATAFPAFYRVQNRQDGLYIATEAPTAMHLSALERV